MRENELNNVIFRIEEKSNSEFLNLEQVERSSLVGVKGTVTVAAINLSDTSTDGGVIIDGEDKTTDNRFPNGIQLPTSRYIINDTTENLFSVNFITDDSGFASIDLTGLLRNTKFIKFYQKYKSRVTFNITIQIPKTDIYNVFVGNAKISPEFKDDENGINFNSYNYYEQDNTITLSPITDKITDLATLRQTYKTAEDNYLLVKKQYESQIVGEVDLEIDTVEKYEPATFKNVITRLLEFQVGTLQPALDYTKTAKLTTEYDRLNSMDKLINILSKMYPNIKIDDGEGIPYNSDIDPKSETL